MAQTLMSVMKQPAPEGCTWCVFTFILNGEIDQSLANPNYGYVIPLGAFPTHEAAVEHVTKLIEKTGHKMFCVVKYGVAKKLETFYDNLVPVPVDEKGHVIKMQQSNEDRIMEERAQIHQELQAEGVLEKDPETMEHFSRHCYLAVDARSNLEKAKESVIYWTEVCEKENTIVQEHYHRHPEHADGWLDYMQKKLFRRREHGLYSLICDVYQQFRNDILGL